MGAVKVCVLFPLHSVCLLPHDAFWVSVSSIAISYLRTLRQISFWPLSISWPLSNPFPWIFLFHVSKCRGFFPSLEHPWEVSRNEDGKIDKPGGFAWIHSWGQGWWPRREHPPETEHTHPNPKAFWKDELQQVLPLIFCFFGFVLFCLGFFTFSFMTCIAISLIKLPAAA